MEATAVLSTLLKYRPPCTESGSKQQDAARGFIKEGIKACRGWPESLHRTEQIPWLWKLIKIILTGDSTKWSKEVLTVREWDSETNLLGPDGLTLRNNARPTISSVLWNISTIVDTLRKGNNMKSVWSCLVGLESRFPDLAANSSGTSWRISPWPHTKNHPICSSFLGISHRFGSEDSKTHRELQA